MTFVPRRRLGTLLTCLLVTQLSVAQSGRAQAPEVKRRLADTEQVDVSLVLIDVVVRDRKDQPVPALTRDDFELRIDGVAVDPSEIESFEERCEGPGVLPTQTKTAGASETTPPSAPHNIVLYFDFSHMSRAGALLAMRGARDYLADHLSQSDRVMILAYKNGLRLVQHFTTDAALLLSRIEALRTDPATVDTDMLEEDANAREVSAIPCIYDPRCSVRRSGAHARALREEMRGRRSLEALTALMPSLAGLRGRKAVVLFTEALRQNPGAELYVFVPATPIDDGLSLEPEMLRLTSEANAAGVSFYTVFAGGLTADDFGSGFGPSRRAGNDSARALQTTLATETGGRALQGSNDVGAILGTASRDLSCYYLLGYRYTRRGDNKQHSILVTLRPDTQRARTARLTVRHRPYYTDSSAEDRRARLVAAALRAPALFHDLTFAAEAFVLGPAQSDHSTSAGRRVLIKTTVPIASLPLLPAGDAWLEGKVAMLGRLTTEKGEQVCDFDHEIPLHIARAQVEKGRLVYETGCALAPGAYALSLIELDPLTLAIGAHATQITVPTPDTAAGGSLSDLQLWTREPETLLVTSGLSAIGMTDAVSERGLVPQSERRMDGKRDAALTFTLCLPSRDAPNVDNPLRVSRTLVGEGDTTVSHLRDLIFTEPPDAETGCYQISTAIRGGTLGDGVYKLVVEASGARLASPLRREADLAVE